MKVDKKASMVEPRPPAADTKVSKVGSSRANG
jgi:hypothetical protein